MVVEQPEGSSSASRKRTFHELMSDADPRFRLGHFRLFKVEILGYVREKDDFLPFQKVFDDAGISLSSFLKETKFVEAANELWELIAKNDSWMQKLIEIVHRKAPRLYGQMLKEIHPDSLECYAKFFSDENGIHMDLITGSLEPLSLARSLPKEYSELLNKVTDYMETKMFDEASCYLMRSLPYVRSVDDDATAWYFDFLNACLRDPNNCTIPRFIDAEYEESLIAYNTRTRMTKAPQASQDGASSSAEALHVIDEDMEDINRPCRSQEEYKHFRLRGLTESDFAKLSDAEEIELRPYQEELVTVAERGVNTIICAPTGSGKTVVAAHIIIDHLKKLQEQDKIGRVAMLVPTIPLVEQQSTMLNKFMRKIFWVEGMSGSEVVSEDGRAPFVLASDITVFTPQIFINLLKSVRKDDRLYFTDFTMFVFDECHHCDRDHPYSVLMRMLHDYEGPKPQIIGLTASLPLGSGRLNVEAALDRMLQLCARLNAHSITTVRKYSKDLSYHVTPPLDEVIRVHSGSKNSFTNALVFCMVRIESAIRPELEHIINTKMLDFRPDEVAFPAEQHSVRYEGFVGSLKARLNELKGGQFKLQLIKTLDHLGYYYRALCLNDLLPDRYAYYYLKNKIDRERIPEDADNRSIQKQLKQLFEKYINPAEHNFSTRDNGENKEILKKLHDVLVNQYEREQTSRTIIFVTTRLLAEQLADHLNRAGVLGRAVVGYVTSSNQASAVSGQTAEEQRRMIDRFNSGLIKVLVATSVAEEGLDISACNLIIKYNNTGSERSLIQRRGRARARNSRSILLVLDGSIEERELENIQKEQLMRLCLDHIQTKSESQMKALVEAKLEEEKRMRKAVLAQTEERRKMLANKSYNLCCRLCGAVICKSSDMRIACDSQYVCCDPDVWKRIDVRVLKNAKSFAIATVVGKPHCMGRDEVECAEDLGTVVKLFGAFLPALSAKSVVVDDPEDTSIRGQKHKKWENIIKEKFFIDPLTERDLKLMLRSLYDFSKDKHDELELEAQLAVERALQAMKKEKKQRFFIEE